MIVNYTDTIFVIQCSEFYSEQSETSMGAITKHNYFVYITTNKSKSVLYTGVTNNLVRRLSEHEDDAKGGKKHFTGRYNVFYLVYYERFQYILNAIRREKEIKGWVREKKKKLIFEFNPEWKFLNSDI